MSEGIMPHVSTFPAADQLCSSSGHTLMGRQMTIKFLTFKSNSVFHTVTLGFPHALVRPRCPDRVVSAEGPARWICCMPEPSTSSSNTDIPTDISYAVPWLRLTISGLPCEFFLYPLPHIIWLCGNEPIPPGLFHIELISISYKAFTVKVFHYLFRSFSWFLCETEDWDS